MKNLRNSVLIAVLLLFGALTACKKTNNVKPEDSAQAVNSAQLFLDDNSSIVQQGNDAVTASYANNTLTIDFSQNGADVELQIPNYDLAASQTDYSNSTAALTLKKNSKTYSSAFIGIPVIVGYPPRPVFVTDKLISITATNTSVSGNATDVAILIKSGSQIITPPISNGNGPVYDTLSFLLGAGGKPNMINVRITQ